MDRVFILDTTLRDGAQSPLISFTEDERVELARALVDLGVDVIDCGYPALSREEEDAVRRLVFEIEGPIVSVLSKPVEKELEVALKVLEGVKRGRVHISAPCSEIRLAHLRGMDREGQIERVVEAIEAVKKEGHQVEVTFEDSFRADRGYLSEFALAVAGKADVINISDTVGIATPSMVKDLVAFLKEKAKDTMLSIHCHDDLGMATANTFAALEAGTRQAHLTIAGVGTRAGNAALEEILVALKLHGESLGLYAEADCSKLYRIARIFSKITGYTIPPHKAVVGDAVFAHKMEYMRLAVVREPRTYEIINPEEIGYPRQRIALSKRSGLYMFKQKVEELGYQLTEEQLQDAFRRFKDLAERKAEIYENDVIAIVEDVILNKESRIKLVSYSIVTGSHEEPVAEVELLMGDRIVKAKSTGDGPVDAAFKAVDEAIGMSGRLVDYRVSSVTSGKDALGEVFLRVLFKGREFTGRAVMTDILQASLEAYINAANKAL